MQEFYFSGTIERVIFENASNFFRILLLEIDETDSDFEDYEIIVTGTMGDVMEGEDYTFWGQLTNHPKYGEQLQMTRYERSKPSASGRIRDRSSISPATILRGLVRKQLSVLSRFMVKTLLTRFSRILAS